MASASSSSDHCPLTWDWIRPPGARAARLAKSGRQNGDPAKAATALLSLVEAQSPPSHLLLGTDALHMVRQKLKQLESEIEAWQAISAATACED